jgi:hypothetical protein
MIIIGSLTALGSFLNLISGDFGGAVYLGIVTVPFAIAVFDLNNPVKRKLCFIFYTVSSILEALGLAIATIYFSSSGYTDYLCQMDADGTYVLSDKEESTYSPSSNEVVFGSKEQCVHFLHETVGITLAIFFVINALFNLWFCHVLYYGFLEQQAIKNLNA